MNSDKEIVLKDLPVIKAATLPNSEKQHDWLLNKTEMTRGECLLLDSILQNYEQ